MISSCCSWIVISPSLVLNVEANDPKRSFPCLHIRVILVLRRARVDHHVEDAMRLPVVVARIDASAPAEDKIIFDVFVP